jgi:hypothetical protein
MCCTGVKLCCTPHFKSEVLHQPRHHSAHDQRSCGEFRPPWVFRIISRSLRSLTSFTTRRGEWRNSQVIFSSHLKPPKPRRGSTKQSWMDDALTLVIFFTKPTLVRGLSNNVSFTDFTDRFMLKMIEGMMLRLLLTPSTMHKRLLLLEVAD